MKRTFSTVLFASLAALLLLPLPAPAAPYVWDGGGDGESWEDDLNWDPDGAPGAGDDVLLPTDEVPLRVVHSAGPHSVNSLTLQEGVTLELTGGSLAVLAASAVQSGGVLILDGGVQEGAGTLTVEPGGDFVWRAGTLRGAGLTEALGGITITGPVQKVIDERQLRFAGTSVWDEGILQEQNGARIVNEGVFDISSAGWLTHGGPSPVGTFVNNGFIRVPQGVLTWIAIPFENEGALQVRGSLNVSGATFRNGVEATVLGDGSLGVDGATAFTNDGVFAPADILLIDAALAAAGRPLRPSVTGYGFLSFAGDYSQTANAILEVDLAGTELAVDYDQLAVSGGCALDGSLAVALDGAFAPALGDSFEVLSCASRSGFFEYVSLPPLAPDLFWHARYGRGLSLDVVDTPPLVAFAEGTSSGEESLTAPQVRIVLSSPAVADVTVNYAVSGGSAAGGGVDYTLNAGTALVPAGRSAAFIAFTVVDDDLAEPDETVEITLSSPSANALVGAPAAHTYTIVDNEPNAGPRASDDFYSAVEDTPLAVASPGVLANDSDPEGDALNVDWSDSTSAGGGAVAVAPDGSFVYTPPPDYFGLDLFEYSASDGLASSAAVVTLSVASLNDPPVAAFDEYATDGDAPLAVPAPGLLANDSDADDDLLTVSSADGTSEEGGAVDVAGDGGFTYTPPAGFEGTDFFTYTASDGAGGSDGAYVYVTVTIPFAYTEDFETGDLSRLPWLTGGDTPWQVQDALRHGGLYAAAAPPAPGAAAGGWLEVTLDLDDGGDLSFWASATAGLGDALLFLVDGVERGSWRETGGWVEATFSVSAGAHTFRWETAAGPLGPTMEAFLDDVVFPPFQDPAYPLSDVKVNGLDGPLETVRGERVAVDIALRAGEGGGAPEDWWVVAEKDGTFLFQDFASGRWRLRPAPFRQDPLEDFGPYRSFEGDALPAGDYTFTFAVGSPDRGDYGPAFMDLDRAHLTVADGFFEDFDDGAADGWEDDGSGSWSVKGGRYRLAAGAGEPRVYHSLQGRSFRDFRYRADLLSAAGGEESSSRSRGLLFRSAGGYDDTYVFHVNPLGYYLLFKRVGGETRYMIPDWTFSPAIRRGEGVWNRLEAICDGDILELRVNGVLLERLADRAFRGGRAGVKAFGSGDDGDRVHFDNAVLEVGNFLTPHEAPPRALDLFRGTGEEESFQGP